jgi:hypothetical protein
MRMRLFRSALASAVVAAVTVGGMAWAGPGAQTTVTIQREGTDLSGTVDSPKPAKCAKDRKIVLFKQKGPEQNPKTDEKIANDTASLSGGEYVWSTGNTGEYGRFYARAARTAECAPDSSPTIRVPRPT